MQGVIGYCSGLRVEIDTAAALRLKKAAPTPAHFQCEDTSDGDASIQCAAAAPAPSQREDTAETEAVTTCTAAPLKSLQASSVRCLG